MSCARLISMFLTFFDHVAIKPLKKCPDLNSIPSETKIKSVLLSIPQLLLTFD